MKRRYVVIGALAVVAQLVFWTIAIEWAPFRGYKLGSDGTEQRDFYFRLIAQHPLGSPEKALVEALHRQGFRAQRPSASDYENAAVMRTGLICTREWWVFWSTNHTERITDITVRRNFDCPAP
jgi:hypothetical protein